MPLNVLVVSIRRLLPIGWHPSSFIVFVVTLVTAIGSASNFLFHRGRAVDRAASEKAAQEKPAFTRTQDRDEFIQLIESMEKEHAALVDKYWQLDRQGKEIAGDSNEILAGIKNGTLSEAEIMPIWRQATETAKVPIFMNEFWELKLIREAKSRILGGQLSVKEEQEIREQAARFQATREYLQKREENITLLKEATHRLHVVFKGIRFEGPYVAQHSKDGQVSKRVPSSACGLFLIIKSNGSRWNIVDAIAVTPESRHELEGLLSFNYRTYPMTFAWTPRRCEGFDDLDKREARRQLKAFMDAILDSARSGG